MYVTAATLLYAWIVYPATMLLLNQKNKQYKHKHAPAPTSKQHVSILLSAWNEENVIADRIANIEKMLYEPAAISVYIGTDGCSDRTAAIIRACIHESPLRITLCEFAENRGKATVLKSLAQKALREQPDAGTVFVFTDANTFFQPDAMQNLIQHFTDARVGGVCGRLLFEHKNGQPEHAYWSWETKLKQAESYYDSCLGANGAIYAIRSSCFWFELPSSTIIDDFIIGMKVREAGLRMVFEPHAIATEDLPDMKDEWHRRVRIGSGAFQALRWCKACLHFRYGRFAVFFWSHKVLRWITPHLVLVLLATAITTLFISSGKSTFFAVTILAGATLFSMVAAIYPRQAFNIETTWTRLSSKCYHFAMMQAALLVGFFRFCRGNLTGKWQRTPRNIQRSNTA